MEQKQTTHLASKSMIYDSSNEDFQIHQQQPKHYPKPQQQKQKDQKHKQDLYAFIQNLITKGTGQLLGTIGVQQLREQRKMIQSISKQISTLKQQNQIPSNQNSMQEFLQKYKQQYKVTPIKNMSKNLQNMLKESNQQIKQKFQLKKKQNQLLNTISNLQQEKRISDTRITSNKFQISKVQRQLEICKQQQQKQKEQHKKLTQQAEKQKQYYVSILKSKNKEIQEKQHQVKSKNELIKIQQQRFKEEINKVKEQLANEQRKSSQATSKLKKIIIARADDIIDILHQCFGYDKADPQIKNPNCYEKIKYQCLTIVNELSITKQKLKQYEKQKEQKQKIISRIKEQNIKKQGNMLNTFEKIKNKTITLEQLRKQNPANYFDGLLPNLIQLVLEANKKQQHIKQIESLILQMIPIAKNTPILDAIKLLSNNIQNLECNLTFYRQQLAKQKQKAEQLQSFIQQLKSKSQTLQEQISKLNSQAQVLKQNINTKQKQKLGLQKQINQLQQQADHQIKRYQGILSQLQSEKSYQKLEIQQKSTKISKLQQELHKKISQNNLKKQQQQNLHSQIQRLTQSINTLQSQKNQLNSMLREKDNSIQYLRRQKTNLKQQAKQFAINIAKQQSTISQLNKNMQSVCQTTYNLAKNICKLNLQIHPNNLKQTINSLEKPLMAKQFMAGSTALQKLSYKEKLFILNEIKLKRGIQPTSSMLLYKLDALNAKNFHLYLDNKQDLLLIVRLENQTVIGGYTRYSINSQNIPGTGFIFSLNNKNKDVILNINHNNPKAKVISQDEFQIIFGNSQIRLEQNSGKVFSNVHILNQFFNGRDQKITQKQFLGSTTGLREQKIITYEFYQMLFK